MMSSLQFILCVYFQKEELPFMVSEIHSQLDGIKEMCHNLIKDQPFKQFLSLVLFIGNYLNAVSINIPLMAYF